MVEKMEKNDSDENKDAKEAKEKIPGAEKALAQNTDRLKINTARIEATKEPAKIEPIAQAFLDAGEKVSRIEQGREKFRELATGITGVLGAATAAAGIMSAMGGGTLDGGRAVILGGAVTVSALSAAVWAIGEAVNKVRQVRAESEYQSSLEAYSTRPLEHQKNKRSKA